MTDRNGRPMRRLAALALVAATGAQAAEGFQVRYNLAGTLGAEMFAPIDQQGWVGSIVRSDARVTKVTGPDGGPLTAMNPAGTAVLANPAPPPATVTANYAASLATLASEGRLLQYNALLAYITPEAFGGGRLALAFNIPYVSKKTQVSSITAATPSATVGGFPLGGAARASFDSDYQRILSSRSAADSGEVDGVGDIELQAGWLRREAHLRVLLGASLVIPTGSSDPGPGPDVSLGNFYTLRPAAQVVWLPGPDWTLGAKATFGISSRNRDNQVRSGNWFSLEGASGWRTPYGVFGLHSILVRQFQDDSGGTWGGNRIRTNNLGLYYSHRVAFLDAGFTAQYMKTLSSRNAKHGDYLQLRLTRAF